MRKIILTPLLTLSLASPLTLPSTPAFADNTLQATYGLYTGGMNMINVDTKLKLEPNNYALRAEASTKGMFARLLPWRGTFDSKGKANFQPTAHDYTVDWRKDSETLRFTYQSPGKLKSVTEIKGTTQTDKTPTNPKIYENTRDLLSALGALLAHYEKTGSCNFKTLTFDGKRSMQVIARDYGTTTLNNPSLSSYTGKAVGCSIKVEPELGAWPKKPRGWIRIQQMGEAKGQLPIIWLAKPENSPHVIPVRIDIHTKYGDVIAHLQTLKAQ